jgi:hypothetical protein
MLILYQYLANDDENATVTGFKVTLNAESVKYVPKPPIRFIPIGEKVEEMIPKASIRRSDGKSIISITYPESLKYDSKAKYELKFITDGLFEKTGEKYKFALQFEEPKAILKNGEEIPLKTGAGTIRIHLPVGTKPLSLEPVPWRIIWQGIGGYENHFVIVYDTFPFTEGITVGFEESHLVRKAVEVTNEIKALDSLIRTIKNQTEGEDRKDVTIAERYISSAKIYQGQTTDALVSGTDEDAEAGLNRTVEYIQKTKASLGILSAETLEEAAVPGEGVLGLIILAIIAIVLVSGIFLLISKKSSSEIEK